MNFLWAGGPGGVPGDVVGSLIWAIIVAIASYFFWPRVRKAVNAWVHGHFERHRALTKAQRAEELHALHVKLNAQHDARMAQAQQHHDEQIALMRKQHKSHLDAMRKGRKKAEVGAVSYFGIALLLGACALIALALNWFAVWGWFIHVTGERAEAGAWYGFWSGFGGAIPDFLILVSLGTLLYHGNCHQKGCWRWGHKLEGTPYRVCHHHHPGHERAARNVSAETIRRAHATSHH